MNAAAAVTLAAVAVVVLIFVMPVAVTLAASGGPRPDRVVIRLWGVAVFRRPASEPTPRRSRPRRRSRPSRKGARRFDPRRAAPLGRIMLGPAGRRLGLRTLRALHMDGRLNVRAGLGDPALTGPVSGFAYAVGPLTGDRLIIEPAFETAALAFDGRLTARTSLGALSWPAVRFLFEPGALRALQVLAFGRRM